MAVALPEIAVDGAPAISAPVAPAPAPAAPEAAGTTAWRSAPGMLAVANADGTVDNVREEDFQAALAEGARPATEAETFAMQQGGVGTAMAAIAGANRGLSFGLSDALTVEADRLLEGDAEAERLRHQLALLKEGHETASLVGEIGGSLLPLAFGAPPGGSAAVAGESLLARAGARALAAAPRAMLEGAAIGIGQQYSEDVLGNHELVAQKYVAKGLEGGLLGLIVGGGLSAGGGAIADKLAGRGAAALERGAAKEGGSVYRALGERLEGAVAKPTMGRIAELAEEQAVKGVLPSASLAGSELQKLGATTEAQMARARRIGRTLLDEGVSTAGASKAVQAERLTAKVAQVGDELTKLRAKLDTSAVRPSAENVFNRIRTEVLEPVMATPFSGDVQNAIKPILAEIDTTVGGRTTFSTFEELFNMRKALDGKLAWNKGIPPPTPALKELRAIRRIMEDEFESAAERAAGDLGENVASQYRAAKTLFSDLKTAEGWATKAAARSAQNRAVSLTDTIVAAAGIASGNPLGVLAAGGNKLMREYGNQAAASLLDRATKIGRLQEAAAAFDTKLAGSVKAFFGGGAKGASEGGARAASKVSPETRAALRAAVSNPSALTERVSSQLASTGMREAAPRVTDAVLGTTMRAAAYIKNRLPPEPKPTGLTFGPQKPRALGLRAQTELDNAVRALDADKALDDLAKGRLDRQAWTAIKIINPPLFDEMVGALQKYGTENQPTVDRQKMVALSIITGQALTPYMEPKTIAGLQQAYATPGPAGPPANPSAPGVTEPKPMGGGGGGGGGTSQRARAFASGSDRLEAGNEI